MKALIYLVGLIGIGVLVAWFGFGIHPQDQWGIISGYAMNTTDKISGHATDTKKSAGKLKNVLGERFDEAADVYHGKEKEDPFKYNQPVE